MQCKHCLHTVHYLYTVQCK